MEFIVYSKTCITTNVLSAIYYLPASPNSHLWVEALIRSDTVSYFVSLSSSASYALFGNQSHIEGAL